jgi:hypothetical protein
MGRAKFFFPDLKDQKQVCSEEYLRKDKNKTGRNELFLPVWL